MINIYTDGSVRNNQKATNVGGWGIAVFIEDVLVYINYGTSTDTTNNKEEFKAIRAAIDYLQAGPTGGTIYSDSTYCLNTLTNWMYNWQRNNWIKSDKKVPENLDIIKELYNKLSNESSINFVKVSGHSGILGNELADALATGDMKRVAKIISSLKENQKLSSSFVGDTLIELL